MDVFSLSWRQGDRKMLQNSCQEKERSEKSAKRRYHRASSAPGLHFSGARR
ncbi:hypothetical protein [Klebsiella pneumoniae IS43]|uniref:Uncharacterized protein n=1 Tax=Klebsiella pneumoniae IS43 TaxID=1432552 RepID=W1DLS7_KLEPN|nr:hypothetical protein [Klebsiella pneumoniae IS43]